MRKELKTIRIDEEYFRALRDRVSKTGFTLKRFVELAIVDALMQNSAARWINDFYQKENIDKQDMDYKRLNQDIDRLSVAEFIDKIEKGEL